ncbi:MAG: hypothetical protein AB8H80_15310 [Planctomycetota bacterium]
MARAAYLDALDARLEATSRSTTLEGPEAEAVLAILRSTHDLTMQTYLQRAHVEGQAELLIYEDSEQQPPHAPQEPAPEFAAQIDKARDQVAVARSLRQRTPDAQALAGWKTSARALSQIGARLRGMRPTQPRGEDPPPSIPEELLRSNETPSSQQSHASMQQQLTGLLLERVRKRFDATLATAKITAAPEALLAHQDDEAIASTVLDARLDALWRASPPELQAARKELDAARSALHPKAAAKDLSELVAGSWIDGLRADLLRATLVELEIERDRVKKILAGIPAETTRATTMAPATRFPIPSEHNMAAGTETAKQIDVLRTYHERWREALEAWHFRDVPKQRPNLAHVMVQRWLESVEHAHTRIGRARKEIDNNVNNVAIATAVKTTRIRRLAERRHLEAQRRVAAATIALRQP